MQNRQKHSEWRFAPGVRPVWCARRERSGTTLIELTACCFLMVVIGGSLLPLLARLDVAGDNHRARQTALVELENLLERASAIPAAEVSQERLTTLAKAMHLEEQIPGVALEIGIREYAEKPSGRQVRYRLTRNSTQGTRELAVLEQWFFNEEQP